MRLLQDMKDTRASVGIGTLSMDTKVLLAVVVFIAVAAFVTLPMTTSGQ